jgi:4-hydroxythreonine-4-phosphate dehydrogenase
MIKTVKLAITMGDPGGIGPEVALKAVCRRKWPPYVKFVLIGCREVWLDCAKQLKLVAPPECDAINRKKIPPVSLWEPSALCAQAHHVALRRPGKTGCLEGKASIAFIRAAVAMCMKRDFDGIVTGPICKKSIQSAGCKFAGHTEYLAHLAGKGRVAMMLIGGKLKVVLVTRHLPLASVARNITRRAVTETVEMTGLGLNWLQASRKTIGVCALNPHAGDGGVLGKEEKTIIAPAIEKLRRMGFRVAGPIPADVIFYQAMHDKFGAVVAMYHDQGLGPLKMIAFDSGVNLTLGLPFVRTSPDHGTAFDIAGRGIASASSMVEAIKIAIRLALRRNPWEK